MAAHHAASTEAMTVALHAAGPEFDIVLEPLSHPELGEIRVDEELFAVGRTEPPFGSYAPDSVAELSRRHARIFCEYGAVYVADLGSKNGTTVNGIDIRQKTSRLQDGDEIRFGKALSYRVRIGARSRATRRPARLLSLTLTPESGEHGLQPIVITEFPFLISKADTTFSRYKEQFPHQVNYISRRHAHIFLKGGRPYVEDLGSTNGTFVSGKRLDEHAVPLDDGELVAFGGHHFVYRVSLQEDEAEFDPTVTKLSQAVRRVAENAGDVDKTTFVAAADSFLDIFCVDRAQQQEDELNQEAPKPADEADKDAGKRKPRSRPAVFVGELARALGGDVRSGARQALRWGVPVVALLAAGALALYLGGSPVDKVKELVDGGDYARAAALAGDYLERHPDDTQLKALGTEALLKAQLPRWLSLINEGQFDRAHGVLADMQRQARHNSDAQVLLAELDWVDRLERFVMERGGVEAPIRLYTDEQPIRALLKQWNDGTQEHQRALTTVASYVPAFRDRYAEALSHLRKLQGDDAVYLAAMDRLKSTIDSELKQGQLDALEPALREYADKYPRIGGLDKVRGDLRQYAEIDAQARARNLGALHARLSRARFATPPFQEAFLAMRKSDRLPPPEVLQQYQAVSGAWRAGDVAQADAGLQKMAAGGPWADAAARERERKQTIARQYADLQKARGGKDYDERLLAFYGALDPDEDAYFVQATARDIDAIRGTALAQAKTLLDRAQSRWRQYQNNGGIEGAQRLESPVSNRFRMQARLLTDAQQDAQQGMRIYTQLKTEQHAQWVKLRQDIDAEAGMQRKSLQELRTVLEPALLKTKLGLLGGETNEGRQSAKAAE